MQLEQLKSRLAEQPGRWLVTGGAGFIGSHLVENLLKLDQEVTCLDNFSAGSRINLDLVLQSVTEKQASRFRLVEGDLADRAACSESVDGADWVLHHAALGSVPLSIENPEEAHRSNVTGTFNLFVAAREAGVKRFVYASSSAVYGNEPGLPKEETMPRNLLSPYAATKAIAEDYADAFSLCYDMEFVGLRYFNVFGPRQDPDGAYAAVIPIWVNSMLRGEPVYINGDGESTRDFTYVTDIVQANLLAATVPTLESPHRICNIAIGGRTSLNELFAMIRSSLQKIRPDVEIPDPVYRDFRPGDVRHSYSDFSRAREELGFAPETTVAEGLELAMQWYATQAESPSE